MSNTFESLKQRLFVIAKQCAEKGPAYSQQRPVLDAVANETGGRAYQNLDLDQQQAILTCWHDLFRDGELSWGYNLDNPDPPFFHIPDRTTPRKRERSKL